MCQGAWLSVLIVQTPAHNWSKVEVRLLCHLCTSSQKCGMQTSAHDIARRQGTMTADLIRFCRSTKPDMSHEVGLCIHGPYRQKLAQPGRLEPLQLFQRFSDMCTSHESCKHSRHNVHFPSKPLRRVDALTIIGHPAYADEKKSLRLWEILKGNLRK